MDGQSMITTNFLVNWHVKGNELVAQARDRELCRIGFDEPHKASVLSEVLQQITDVPMDDAPLLELAAQRGILDGADVFALLMGRDVLTRVSADAAEARVYHAVAERDPFRRDLSTEDLRALFWDAHRAPEGAVRPLPAPELPAALTPLVGRGRSHRPTHNAAIGVATLSGLLAFAHGRYDTLTDGAPKDAPALERFRGMTGSGGGFYPVRLLIHTPATVAAERPHGWLYVRGAHGLTRMDRAEGAQDAFDAATKPIAEWGFGAMISVLVDLSCSEVKYGNHAYRLALLEAGAVMQNLRLAAPHFGLEGLPLGVAVGPELALAHPERARDLHVLTMGFGGRDDDALAV
ncbi:hypothetical protein A8B78_04320 [Jannaschia sp. EhC01]|nr:hypothetical protein A8B78_04320 [Jannaschia sp. EhC01]